MSAPRIEGRPDWSNPGFGRTTLKRHPPYVYARRGGMLVHKVLRVEASWYRAVWLNKEACETGLERLPSPRITFYTVCGQMFYGHSDGKLGPRTQVCKVPAPDAVLCGRCHGTGPVFGKGLAELTVKREEAKRRLGCVAEAV